MLEGSVSVQVLHALKMYVLLGGWFIGRVVNIFATVTLLIYAVTLTAPLSV
jgi:hypothetical protein